MENQIKRDDAKRREVIKNIEEACTALYDSLKELNNQATVTDRIEEAAYWCTIQALRLVRTIKRGPKA